MSKSKRKRQGRMKRLIPTEELGPNFIVNLKHGMLSGYAHEVKALEKTIIDIHKSIGEDPEKRNLHSSLTRWHLIEGLTVLDLNIGNVLSNHQIRNLNKKPMDVESFSKIEEGLKRFLIPSEMPKELDKANSLMKNYRALRNQFSHYQIGIFAFSAKHESFESFLLKLNGIKTGQSEHMMIDRKPGVFLPYGISSNKYIGDFNNDSLEYLSMLIEHLFPTHEKKVFEFKK